MTDERQVDPVINHLGESTPMTRNYCVGKLASHLNGFGVLISSHALSEIRQAWLHAQEHENIAALTEEEELRLACNSILGTANGLIDA
ncbi:hypothetical protein QYF36_025303 [Acer negundo]|nr:hypothetical protein QYF36_025303 [Acer negundo]